MDLNLYRCSYSNEIHLVNEPVALTCSHFICKKCIPPLLLSNDHQFNCVICLEINKNKLEKNAESIEILKNITKDILEGFLKASTTNNHEKTQQLIESKKELETRLESQFCYVDDEIEIRIESLKIDLEKLHKSFNRKLSRIEKKRIKKQRESLDKAIAVTNQFIHSEKLMEFGFSEIRNLVSIINVSFISKEDKPKRNMIGRIDEDDHESLIKRITKGGYECFAEVDNINYFHAFKDEFIFATTGDRVKVYDKNLKFLKEKQLFDENAEKLIIMCITSNQKNRLYLTYMNHSRISMTDIDLTLLHTTYGQENNQLAPICLVYDNGLVINCDYGNRQIFIYTEELKFIKKIDLEYKPMEILVIDDTICVLPWGRSYLRFYKLKTFCFRNYYEATEGSFVGVMCKLNQNFYEFNYVTKKIKCFNKNGDLIKDVDTKINEVVQNDELNHSILITGFNKKILLYLKKVNKFIII